MRISNLVVSLGLFSSVVGAAGCNLITGADDLQVRGGGTPGSGGEGGSTAATQAGPTGNGTNATNGSPASQVSATTGMPLVDADVQGVTVDRIEIYQGVQAVVMDGRSPSTPVVPIIAEREALVRVFVELAGYDGAPVTARLTFGDGTSIDRQLTLTSPSVNDLGSTVNFEVPPEKMVAPFSYRVSIVRPAEAAGPANADAHYPSATDTADLVLKKTGAIRVVLIPIRYNGDGSGRLPDLSATGLGLIQTEFDNQYPAEKVELTVGPQYTYNSAVGGTSGWNEILDAITALRASDNPASDVYYYGLFNPRATYDTYLNNDCGGGSCYAGLGWIAQPVDANYRAAVGLGYTDVNAAAVTATHELGHNHGREHAPCGGAQGVDPNYPYADGTIGPLGYDRAAGQLIDNGSNYDIMSYCFPHWASDYTYRALADRIAEVHAPPIFLPNAPADFQRVEIMNGKARRLPTMRFPRAVALTDTARLKRDAGDEVDSAVRFMRYDHIDGGVLLVPAGADLREVQVNGQRYVVE